MNLQHRPASALFATVLRQDKLKLHTVIESERKRAMDRLELLKSLSFGSQVAEEEIQSLGSYFVKTDQWSRIVKGEIDIVRGEKGAGKSALYLLLAKNQNILLDRGVVTVNAENPRGATVFKDLVSDPPTGEVEFVVLWKIYILVVICHELKDLGVKGKPISDAYEALEGAKLMERELNLASLLRSAQAFARRLLNPTAIEGSVSVDPSTGIPLVSGKLSLAEPNAEMRSQGFSSVDGLYAKVNKALENEKLSIWVLLDRLDVAFSESHELEANALRALIKVYGDLRGLDSIDLKIFIREDIWKRITDSGLREASHITKFAILDWSQASLLNLILRRLLNNEHLIKTFGIDAEDILSDTQKQDKIFARFFPPQVEQGPQKAPTFKWMVTRCADSTAKTAPRELIHLLNCIKDQEIRRLERGGNAPPNDQLFDRSVFKLALPTVSDTRLNTYLYAEYPKERPYLEKLDGQKTEQTPESLAELWNLDRADTIKKAAELVDLGFFEARGTRHEPTYWVPFLYRDALHLVQGKAEADDES